MSEGGDETDIRRLDQSTIERIAAGEVVERPASVVKELVENSLDADASRVRVAVERGGKDGIRVTDDGVGMTRENVERAVEKHTTSKIADIADLEAGVGSLGFRGEALAAIGAVSRVTIRTKARDAARGTELRMAGGEVESVEPAGCPEGTTVEVTDPFYNVPARRKYLKQDATEFAHVNRIATGYALSNPDVALVLEHDDREVFSTTGQGSLEATILAVYGREVAEAMIPVGERAGADDGHETAPAAGTDGTGETGDTGDPDGPLDAIAGVVSHPETTRASARHCSVFVNGRYVTASAVRDAIVEAYGTQLAPDRYPFAVLFLSLPANAVDVNVHPRKLEVRFADEAGAKEQVRTAVENALLQEGLVRSGAPRGGSAPEQTPIEPAGAESEGAATNPSSKSTNATEKTGSVAIESEEPPTSNADDGTATTDAEPPSEATNTVEHAEPTLTDAARPSDRRRTATPSGTEASAGDESEHDERAAGTDRKFAATVGQTTLDGESATGTPEFDRLPRLRVLGQVHDTYIVCESPDGVVLIDQHAADERVNYERLRERVAEDPAVQELADPVEIELTPEEGALYEAFADALADLGFRASEAGERRVEVTAVPAVLAGAADPELLRDALSAFVADERPEDAVERTAEALLADLACYPSITGNTSLTEGTVVELLHALDACENPYACPHGRPVLVELGTADLDERFERDYPGHAGRRFDDAT